MVDRIDGAHLQDGLPQFLQIAKAIIRYRQIGAIVQLENVCFELGQFLQATRCAILQDTQEDTPTIVTSWNHREMDHTDPSLFETWPELENNCLLHHSGISRFSTCTPQSPQELILMPINDGRAFLGALALEFEQKRCCDIEIDCLNTLAGLLSCAICGSDQKALPTETDSFSDVLPNLMSRGVNRFQKEGSVDELTGLMARHLFMDTVSRFIEYSSQNECFGGFFLIDLDDFRVINDAEGHAMGDRILASVASRLAYIVPPGGALARLEGDAFALASPRLGQSEVDARESAQSLLERIYKVLSRPLTLDSLDIVLTASIGVALFYNYASTFDELLRHAELSMYKAKDDGKNRSYFFSTELQRTVNERADLDSALRVAVVENQFKLNYQLQVDRCGTPTGVEALIRWYRPDVGMVSPAVFIPFAENSGLIHVIGLWALKEACRQLAQWAVGEGRVPELVIAVNVSSEQFKQASFVNDVISALDESGAPARRLKLELTESVLAQDLAEVRGKMLQLKDLGVCLSLDDFGKGYSSLQYLKELPFDELKVDQSFVRGVTENHTDYAIASMILSLAKSTGLSALAEGVETREQLEILLSLGCPSFQGYLFGFPQEPKLIADAVLAHPARD